MDLRLDPEQEQLVGAFDSLFERHATTEHVRAAEPTGFDAALWERVTELGVVPMAVPQSAGGWGASTVDLALVAERIGASLAPVPVIEAQVAARLLERAGGPGRDVLDAVLAGERLVTIGLRPARDGVVSLVPAAAVATDSLVVVDDALALVRLDPAPTHVENLGSMPVADVTVPADATVLLRGPQARRAYDAALDDWLTLTGAALIGLAQRALDIGVAYVKERHAFGVPIGSFQSIAHRLADSATAIDAALMLTRSAAWSAQAEPHRHGELAAMGFSLAAEAARDVTYRSLHYHGGYGFMMEYDIQLSYRRARGWANVFGGPGVVHRRIADKRYGAVATSIT